MFLNPLLIGLVHRLAEGGIGWVHDKITSGRDEVMLTTKGKEEIATSASQSPFIERTDIKPTEIEQPTVASKYGMNMLMHGPSPHLAWSELASTSGKEYPDEWRATRAVKLACIFECIRTACGNTPLAVSSGYRTRVDNRACGGAKKSYHLTGEAIDIQRPRMMGADDFHAHVKRVAKDIPYLGGLGFYPWGIHADLRKTATGRIVMWRNFRKDQAGQVRSLQKV